MTPPSASKLPAVWRAFLGTLTLALPIFVLAALAAATYWLVRNAPQAAIAEPERPKRHVPDYFMRDFAVRSYEPSGRLLRQFSGKELRHYPDTDTVEVDLPRVKNTAPNGRVSTALADKALTNGDASEVQLMGNAVVVREALVAQGVDAAGERLEVRGEFLHVFHNTERLKSNKPVVITRGQDRYSADSFEYDGLNGTAQMDGRVQVVISPRNKATP